jgi:hypothetical protein
VFDAYGSCKAGSSFARPDIFFKVEEGVTVPLTKNGQ